MAGVLGVLAAAAVIAPAASAEHRAGVTYTGTTTNAGYAGPVSGTVELDISPDGSAVTRFAVNFVMPSLPFGPPSCAGTTVSETFTGSVPITTPEGYPPDYHFFDTSPVSAPATIPLDFDGAVGGSLDGRFSYEAPDYPNSGCTTGGGIGFEGAATCMAPATHASAEGKIDALKAKIKKLKAKIKAAKRADAPDRVKKLKKKLKKLKKLLAEAQADLLAPCPVP